MSVISFSNALRIHPEALLTRAERSEVIANNLANSDTPGFKARDFDFQAVLSGEVKKTQSMNVDRTDDGHLTGRARSNFDLAYRTPLQPSIDGNTVDDNTEHAEFTKNAMAYNASFEFLNGKFKGLSRAIKGQ